MCVCVFEYLITWTTNLHNFFLTLGWRIHLCGYFDNIQTTSPQTKAGHNSIILKIEIFTAWHLRLIYYSSLRWHSECTKSHLLVVWECWTNLYADSFKWFWHDMCCYWKHSRWICIHHHWTLFACQLLIKVTCLVVLIWTQMVFAPIWRLCCRWWFPELLLWQLKPRCD